MNATKNSTTLPELKNMVNETVGILFSYFVSLYFLFFFSTPNVVYFRPASSHMKCRLTILPSAKKKKN